MNFIKICFVVITFFSLSLFAGENCQTSDPLLIRAKEYYQKGQYLFSAMHFSFTKTISNCESIKEQANWGYVLSMHLLGENKEVIDSIDSYLSNNTVNQEKYRLLKGILDNTDISHLSSFNQQRLLIWEKRKTISKELDQISALALSNADRDKIINLSYEIEKKRSKSPIIAASLSAVIPGLGQAYSGALQSAAMAFIINSLFLGTTITFAKKDLKFPAIASGFVFGITYVGNIFNAASTANRVNDSNSVEAENEMKRVLLPELNLE